jgi:GNAT superfamily N-acetyltransferase
MDFIDHWTLPNGTPLSIRPVQPQDADQLDALITGLPAADRWWRFHGAVNGVTPQRLRSMVTPQAPDQLALVAVAHLPGRDTLMADARCALDGRSRSAEFGLMVATGWRRLGIGERLMSRLQMAAAEQGLRWLHGSVLADNTPMLALMQRCGFRCTPHRGNAHLVVVEACIEPPRRGHPLPGLPRAPFFPHPHSSL